MKKILLLSSLLLSSLAVFPAKDRPMMGWSSWNAFKVHISEDIIKRQAFLLDSLGLRALGYQYVNIDDGFFGYRDKQQGIVANRQRFPNGLLPVTSYIHSLGLKAGIYSDAGTRTCGSMWDNDVNGNVAGLYGHEASDCKRYFRDWNFDFIKVDYCGAQSVGMDERRRYTSIARSIAQYGRPDVKLNICRWAFPGTWAEKLACSWRISGDIQTNWNSLKYVIGKNLYLSAYARNGHYNDMDMLIVGMRGKGRLQGEGLTDIEDETHFGMWCMMSSPLLIGCDLSKLSPQSLALLKNKELIDVDQDTLGLQARVYQHRGETYVLAKDLLQRNGRIRAVALYNPADTASTFRVPLADLCLSGKVKVRDLLRHQWLKSVKNELVMTVQPHATACLRLEAQRIAEPRHYEAEWAYLPMYNDIGKSKYQILPAVIPGASGGMGVINVGGQKGNYLQWDDVYSVNGGEYNLDVTYANDRVNQYNKAKETRTMVVWVNGKEAGRVDCPYGEGCRKATMKITLRQGQNTIRIGNKASWSPDIDCIDLTSLQ